MHRFLGFLEPLRDQMHRFLARGRSVGWSVGWSVGRSVGRLVGRSFGHPTWGLGGATQVGRWAMGVTDIVGEGHFDETVVKPL